MKWGPRMEESLQMAKRLPTPTDAVVSHEEGCRLHYLRQTFHSLWIYGLVQKIMVVYGPSIAEPSPRLATLTPFDRFLPHKKRCEEYLRGGITAFTKKDVSTLGGSDLVTVAFLALSTSWLKFDNKGTSPRLKIPSSSVHLRWFLEIMKDLLHQANGNVLSHPFGEF